MKSLLSELKHLFIFVSHRDEDHINYLNEETIPENLPITVFLFGDWFGNVCSSPDDLTASDVVKKVLSFFATRDKTHLEFPYYWEFSTTREEFNDFVRREFLSLKNGANPDETFFKLAQLTSKTNFISPSPVFFSGTFDLFLSRSSKLGGKLHDELIRIMRDQDITEAIRNIYIWSVNLPTSDVNDFSPIISCTLPSADLTVVLTGDAGVPVFQTLQGIGYDCRKILGLTPEHLVMLMLPHHGSWLNVGGEMLRFFKPNVFGIAAGNGGQYGHPSLKSISWAGYISTQENFHGLFHGKYSLQGYYRIIAIAEPINGKRYPHEVIKAKKDFPVFLCPNIYGCLKWDKDGIYSNFDNTIALDGRNQYIIDYSTHAYEVTENLNTKQEKNPVTCLIPGDSAPRNLIYQGKLADHYLPYKYLLKDGATFYVGLPVADKVLLYELIPSASA